MNKHIIAVAVVAALGITGCSTTKSPTSSNDIPQPTETKVAVKDRVVAAHFKDQGIELHYTLMGKLEKIYVWGVAPAWKGQDQMRILAELDAKIKLMKFVHGEQVDSSQRAQIIARSLDKARDNTLNRFDSNTSQEADFSFDAAQIEAEIQRTPDDNKGDNTTRRIAETIDRTVIDQVQTLTASGRLRGVIKVDDGRSRDGKMYFAKYEWSEKTQAASQFMRERMQ